MLSFSVFFISANVYPGVRASFCQQTDKEYMLSLSVFLISATVNPDAEYLDEIETKVFRVFPLVIQSHLYSYA